MDEQVLMDLKNKYDIYVPDNLVPRYTELNSWLNRRSAVSGCDLVLDVGKRRQWIQ